MANDEDLARLNYVIDNYDSVQLSNASNNSYKNADNTPAQTIIYQKRVNGDYYVVEAVPDSKAKKLQIVTAYKTKKAAQFVADSQSSQPNAQSEQTTTAYNATIPQQESTVNAYAKAYEQMLNNSMNAEKSAANAENQVKERELSEEEKRVKRFIKTAALNARLDVRYKDMPLNQKAYYKDGTIYINQNRPLNEGMKATVAHEIFHSLEGSKEHDRIVELALQSVGEGAIQRKIDSYGKYGIALDEAGAKAEIGAEYIEKALTDEATINQILLENKSLAGRIWERIKDLIAFYKAKKSMTAEEAREYKALLKAKHLYEDGLAKLNSGEYEPYSGERNARYQSERMGGYFPDNEVSAKDVEQYKIKNINNKYEVISKLKQALAKTYLSTEKQSKPIINLDTGMEIEIRQGGINETFGKDEYYLNLSSEEKLAKIATMSKLANLIKYGEVRAEEAANYHNPNSKVRYAYLTAPIKVDGKEYVVNMDIRKSPNGENRFYIHSLDIKKDAESLLPSMRVVKGEKQTSTNNIPDTVENVNTQNERFSIDEQTESPQFKEWFGDSKVVDGEGKPKVVYSGHGNTNLFGSKFDVKKATSGGFYFTEDADIASSYAKDKLGNLERYENGSEYRFKNSKGEYKDTIDKVRLNEEQAKVFDEWFDEDMGYTFEDYVRENAPYDEQLRGLSYNGGKYNLQNIYKLMESLGYVDNGWDYRTQQKINSTFEDLLDEMGIAWDSYTKPSGGVFPVYLSIKNPIDTSKEFPQDLMNELEYAASKERKSEGEHWTKDYPLKKWVEDIKNDDGLSGWATQVPTKARKIMLEMGYDGIKDTGGKQGGAEHVVWVALEPTQVKSAIGNRGTFDAKKADIRYSIDEDFISNYDKWVADGRNGGKSIKVGRTSEALQSVGVRENQVRIDTSKINKIQQKHPTMTDDVIKKVPEILEKPIVIMESLGNQDSQKAYNNRLTLFGEVMDTEGKNVLAVLELEPTDKVGNVLNLTKIASAYGRNAQYLLDNSKILYIEPNKKRTNDWLRLLGLQLPVGLTNKSGSIGRISYNNPFVKEESEKYSIDTTDPTNHYEELIEQYGEMDKGMEPRVDRAVPKQTNDWDKVRKFTRTAMESENINDEAKGRIEDELASDINSGRFVYEPISNQKLQDEANQRIRRNGYEGSKGAVFAKYRNNERIRAEDVAELEQLIVKASAEGRSDDVMDMVGLAAMVGTEMGQNIQAMSMLKRMTPEGKLKQMYLLRDRLNSKYELSGNEEVEVNKRLAGMLLNKDNTAEDTEVIQEYIISDLAKQLPVGKKDKIDAWRYLAMLGNPRTHVRNIIGNVLNLTVTRLNDQLAGLVERIALKEGKRTKSAGVVSKDLKEFAKSDWEESGKYLTDLSSKYGERGQAERDRQIFKTKALEWARKANEGAMEAEDAFFKKKQYIYALSHYMKANKISAEEMQNPNSAVAIKARKYAAEEALRVTFQEKNELANMLNHFEHKESDSKLTKAGQLAVKAMVPFKKTPLNILKRGVEYSPVSIAEGLNDIIRNARKKDAVSGAEIIEEMTRGLTGSGIIALGYFLAEMGLLSSGYDEENKREQTFENQIGGQNFAFTIPGVGSYTLDWAAPVVMPLFVGGALYNDIVSRTDGEGVGLKDVGSAMIKITDPILEMSCMDSLQSALTSFGNEGLTSNIIISATESYLLQFVPTLSGQIARTIDDTKRSTYAPSDSKYTKTGESLGRQFRSKIPLASFKNEASVDVWGRERKQSGDNVVSRAAFNMLSPGSYAKSTETATDRELKRLYEESGESGVLPKMGNKYISFKADGKHSKTYYLTAKEYTKYQKKYGQDNFKAVSELVRSNVYKSMSDEDKAKAVKEIYTYNAQMANKEFFKGRDIEYDNGASMTEKLKDAGGWIGYFENKQAFSKYNAQREANDKQALDYDDMMNYKAKCDKYGMDYTAYAESREKISELKSANTEKFEALEEQGKTVKSSDKTEANKRAIAKYLASRKDLTNSQRQVIWSETYKGKTSETYISVARRYGF